MKVCPECKTRFSRAERFCPRCGVRLLDMRRGTVELYDPLVGRLIDGRYRIVTLLQETASSVLYQAVHEPLNRRVQIRLLRRELARDPAWMRNLLEKARLEASLAHPNVLRVLDSGYAEDTGLYVVSEYLDGTHLASLLAEAGSLEVRRALDLAVQMSAGLGAAHAVGLVHGNLSPATVLVTREESLETVKLMAFSGPLLGTRSLPTTTGFVEGQPEFMTPEHASGRSIGPQSDIYALGVILYAMVTGRVPFSEDSFTRTLWAHLRDPVPDPRLFRPNLPNILRGILATALAKDPADRFASAAAFEEGLRTAIRALETPGGGTQRPARDSSRRPPAKPPAGPAAVPSATRTDVPVPSPAGRSDGATATSPSGGKLRVLLPWAAAALALGTLAGATALYLRSTRLPATSRPSAEPPRHQADGSPAHPLEAPDGCCRKSARLVVHTEPPGALVRLNGRPLGVSPLSKPVPCTSKVSIIRAEKPGFGTREVETQLCGTVRVVLQLPVLSRRRGARPGRGARRSSRKPARQAGRHDVGPFKTPRGW